MLKVVWETSSTYSEEEVVAASNNLVPKKENPSSIPSKLPLRKFTMESKLKLLSTAREFAPNAMVSVEKQVLSKSAELARDVEW